MAELPTAATSIAVLLGASQFPRYPSLPANRAFATSATALNVYLRGGPVGLGLPEDHILDLFDSAAAPGEQIELIHDFLKDRELARDLIVYYCGHGALAGPAYFLATRWTKQDLLPATGLSMDALGSVLRRWARRRRTLLILDCCFAAEAVRSLQSPIIEGLAARARASLPVSGCSLLAAASRDDVAIAPAGEPYTCFSGCLLEVLHRGRRDLPERMSVRDVLEEIEHLLCERFPDATRPELHVPQQSAGDVAAMPFFPNPARMHRPDPRPAAPPAIAEPPPPPPPALAPHPASGTAPPSPPSVLPGPVPQWTRNRVWAVGMVIVGPIIVGLAFQLSLSLTGVGLDNPLSRESGNVLDDPARADRLARLLETANEARRAERWDEALRASTAALDLDRNHPDAKAIAGTALRESYHERVYAEFRRAASQRDYAKVAESYRRFAPDSVYRVRAQPDHDLLKQEYVSRADRDGKRLAERGQCADQQILVATASVMWKDAGRAAASHPCKDRSFLIDMLAEQLSQAARAGDHQKVLELCETVIARREWDAAAVASCADAACRLKDSAGARKYIAKIADEEKKSWMRDVCRREGLNDI